MEGFFFTRLKFHSVIYQHNEMLISLSPFTTTLSFAFLSKYLLFFICVLTNSSCAISQVLSILSLKSNTYWHVVFGSGSWVFSVDRSFKMLICVLNLLPNISSNDEYPDEFGTLLMANNSGWMYRCHCFGCSTINFLRIAFIVEWLLSITLLSCGWYIELCFAAYIFSGCILHPYRCHNCCSISEVRFRRDRYE